MRQIIAVCGYKGCGKTTAARVFYQRGFTRVRFAEGLKSMLKVLGLNDAELDGELKEAKCELLNGATPRHAMQTLGQEWGRNLISATLWIDHWKRSIAKLPAHTPIVVDDLRYPNEQEALWELQGEIIFIDRPGLGRTSSHASEDLSHITPDYKISNDGTEGDFVKEVGELIDLLRNK